MSSTKRSSKRYTSKLDDLLCLGNHDDAVFASDEAVLPPHLVQTLILREFHPAQVDDDVAGLLEGEPHVVLDRAATATVWGLDLPL